MVNDIRPACRIARSPTGPEPSPMSQRALAAERLQAAHRGMGLQPAPALADEAEAYAVQDDIASALRWFGGAVPTHWKSGGPAPDGLHAPLPPAGVRPSPARLSDLHFTLRGIEAEVALRLGQPVDAALAARLDRTGALALVDAMAVAIEVVDSRWREGLDAPPLAKLADLLCHGAIVIGDWTSLDRTRNWSTQAGRVRVGRGAWQPFRGSHPMGEPAAVLPAWLRHATRHGAVLPAGSVVTTGSWCPLLHAAPGDEVVAEFDAIGDARLVF